MSNKKFTKPKTPKELASLTAIIILLSLILAGTLYYGKGITADAVRKAAIDGKIEKIQFKQVNDVKELSQLNEGWYKIMSGLVYYLETFDSYAPLYIKVNNPRQQNGLIVVDADGTIRFSERFDGLAEEENKITGNVAGLNEVSSAAVIDEKKQTYLKLISDAEKKYNIPKGLLENVVRKESNFDEKATSRKGAQGLTQLMPGTVQSLNKNYPDDVVIINAYDPYQNINGGAKLLGLLLKKYNNDLRLTLAAYNAGEPAVDRYSGVPAYPETQDYVKVIMERFSAQSDPSDTFKGIPLNELTTTNRDQLSQSGVYMQDYMTGTKTFYTRPFDINNPYDKKFDEYIEIKNGIVSDSFNPIYRGKKARLFELTSTTVDTSVTGAAPVAESKNQPPQDIPYTGNNMIGKEAASIFYRGDQGEIYGVTSKGVWGLKDDKWVYIKDKKLFLEENQERITPYPFEVADGKSKPFSTQPTQKAGTDNNVIKAPTLILTKGGAKEIEVKIEGDNIVTNIDYKEKKIRTEIPIALLEPNDARKVDWKSYDAKNPYVLKFTDGRIRNIDTGASTFTDRYKDGKEVITTITPPKTDEAGNVIPIRPNEMQKKVVESVPSGKTTKIETITTFGNGDTEKVVKEGDVTKSAVWTSKKYGGSINIDSKAYGDISKLDNEKNYPDMQYRLRQMAFYSKIKNINSFDGTLIKEGEKRVIVGQDNGLIFSVKGDNLLASELETEGVFYTFENTKWDDTTQRPKFNIGARFFGEKYEKLVVAAKRVGADSWNQFIYHDDKVDLYEVSGVGSFANLKNLQKLGDTTKNSKSDFKGTLTVNRIEDSKSPFLNMYPAEGGYHLQASYSAFGALGPYWVDSNGNKVKDYKTKGLPDPKLAEKALDMRANKQKLSTPSERSSQRFFADVERVFTEFNGLGYYATLFFDEDSLLEWRDNVDRIFATAFLGTEYWSSAICGTYLDGEDEGIAYAETPQGLSQVGAHIEATRTQPFINENGAKEFIYKITFNIRNGDYEKDPRAPEEMNFNVFLKGAGIDRDDITNQSAIKIIKPKPNEAISEKKKITKEIEVEKNIRIQSNGGVRVFKNDQNVTRGSSFGRIGKSAIVKESRFLYDKICITFDKIPSRWKLDDNELCNKIQESSGEAATLASLNAATAGGGGRSDEIDDF